jgi:lipopolysaccharide export system protein LptA
MGLEASGPSSNLESVKLSKVQNLQPPLRDTAAIPAVNLLKHYGFEGALTAKQLTDQWQQYPSNWVRLAMIEALYQGRYKAVSVEKILAAWQRRGQPLYHFDQEFERLVYAQSQQTGKQAGYDDPMNRSDVKSPSPASLLEPVAQTSPVPAPNGDSPPETPRDRGESTQKNPDEESLELYADRQEYDDVRRIFTAVGNVLLRFRGATLRANQLQVNLQTQLAVAEGNIRFTRGEQKLQGDRLEYNYVQNQGSFANARGEIYLPTASTDISATTPTGERTGFPTDDDETGTDDINPDGRPLSEQIQENQPRQVRATEEIQRLRFEAERIEFNARGWEAQDIRITNDPFSPPELEVRADEARLVRVSSLEDRGEATRPRIVFDRGLSLPILRSRVVFDRRERDPAIAQIGFDESERGGVFIGRTFEPLLNDQTSLTITPQFFLQRAVETSNFNVVDPDLYGLNVRLNSTLTPLISLTGSVILTSFDPTDISDNLRANLGLQRPIETPIGTHRLALGYSYRDRVYNGSLGFQDIQNSLGAVLTSPTISLGNTGIDLNYQVSTQYITAETEQFGLADPASLGRFQASASLRRGFYLWQGQALPATATAGLKYTPEPVVPYLQLFTRLTGIANAYTSGDTQETLLGRVGLQGQFGHFSRPFLDYTGFNISYSQIGLLGLSPFLFDRVTDFKVLSAGIVQQIYGPIRAGVQVALSLDTGEAFDIEYLLEYNRRTYGVFLRYNPSREIGSVNFRLNGFNWTGGTAPFSEPEVLP